jgi:hypothetical protein
MEAAQEVHGIREVAARVAPRRLKKRIQIGMSSAALGRDARELGFGNAGRLVADGPI